MPRVLSSLSNERARVPNPIGRYIGIQHQSCDLLHAQLPYPHRRCWQQQGDGKETERSRPVSRQDCTHVLAFEVCDVLSRLWLLTPPRYAHGWDQLRRLQGLVSCSVHKRSTSIHACSPWHLRVAMILHVSYVYCCEL